MKLRHPNLTRIINKKYLLILFLQLFFCSLFGQNVITFKEPLTIFSLEKVNPEIKNGTELLATSLSYSYNDGHPLLMLTARNLDGSPVSF